MTGFPSPSFEVVSIELSRSSDPNTELDIIPQRLRGRNTILRHLIAIAYGMRDFQILGGPNWINSDGYDIEAKVGDELADQIRKLPMGQQDAPLLSMTQSMLADRFKLSVSHSTKELPIYALVIDKNGPKLQEAKPGHVYSHEIQNPKSRVPEGLVVWRDRGALWGLARQLSGYLSRTVLDRSGLKGEYDFSLAFVDDRVNVPMFGRVQDGQRGSDNPPPSGSGGPSIFSALKEQLGLKLVPTKGPVEVIIIDHIERPSPN